MLLFYCKNCRGLNRQLHFRPPSISPDQKEKALSVLCLDFVSSEDSTESDTDSDDFQRDIQSPVANGHKAKRLVRRQLKWRTRKTDDVMATLEQKYHRQQSQKSRDMMTETVDDSLSSLEKPLHIPAACAADSCHEH